MGALEWIVIGVVAGAVAQARRGRLTLRGLADATFVATFGALVGGALGIGIGLGPVSAATALLGALALLALDGVAEGHERSLRLGFARTPGLR